MGVFINTAALAATSFKSDSLGVLAAIIHPLGVGEYEGEVYRDRTLAAQFTVTMAKDAVPSSVQIDLEAIAGPRAARATPKYRATTAEKYPGYVVFYVAKGEGGFHVILKSKGKAVFDSRRLDKGDVYAVTLVRPGRYDMAAGKGAAGRIDVSAAIARAAPKRESATANVTVGAGGLKPAQVAVEQGDSVVFGLETPAVVAVVFRNGDKSGKRPKRPIRPVRVLGPDHLEIAKREKGGKPPRARAKAG